MYFLPEGCEGQGGDVVVTEKKTHVHAQNLKNPNLHTMYPEPIHLIPLPKVIYVTKKKKVSDQGGFEAREDKGERSVEILNIMAYL